MLCLSESCSCSLCLCVLVPAAAPATPPSSENPCGTENEVKYYEGGHRADDDDDRFVDATVTNLPPQMSDFIIVHTASINSQGW